MADPARGVRFRAHGPVEVEWSLDECYVGVHPFGSNFAWGISRKLVGWLSAVLDFDDFGLALMVPLLLLFGLPIVFFFLLGIPLWLWSKWAPPIRADRSGIRLPKRHLGWNEVERVSADNVEWHQTSPPYIRHAIVLHLHDQKLALLTRTFPQADALAEQLEFLRRTSVGTRADVPPELERPRKALET